MSICTIFQYANKSRCILHYTLNTRAQLISLTSEKNISFAKEIMYSKVLM